MAWGITAALGCPVVGVEQGLGRVCGVIRGRRHDLAAEARRQIDVASTYEDWEAEVRREDFWDLCQERRAWMLGEVLADGVIASARHREVVRRLVAKDEAEVALWSEVDIRADYSPAEVGEG